MEGKPPDEKEPAKDDGTGGKAPAEDGGPKDNGAKDGGATETPATGSPIVAAVNSGVAKLIGALLSTAGLLSVVALTGQAILWARFIAIGMPAEQAVALVPRDDAIVAGAIALTLFIALGAIAVAGVYALDAFGRATDEMRPGLCILITVETLIAIVFMKDPGDTVWPLILITCAVGAAGVAVTVTLAYLAKRKQEREAEAEKTAAEAKAAADAKAAEAAEAKAAAVAAASELAAANALVEQAERAERRLAPAADLAESQEIAAAKAVCVVQAVAAEETAVEANAVAAQATQEADAAADAAAREANQAEAASADPEIKVAGVTLGREAPDQTTPSTAGVVTPGQSVPPVKLHYMNPWLLLTAAVVCAIVAASFWWAFDMPVVAGALVLASLLGAMCFGIARASQLRFWPYGLAIFFSVVIFGAALSVAKMFDERRANPVALLRAGNTGTSGVVGLLIARADDRYWLGAVAVCAGRNEPIDGTGRIFSIPQSQVLDDEIGTATKLTEAQERALVQFRELRLRQPEGGSPPPKGKPAETKAPAGRTKDPKTPAVYERECGDEDEDPERAKTVTVTKTVTAPPARTTHLLLGDEFFQVDSDSLGITGLHRLRRLRDELDRRAQDVERVQIVGHADFTGTRSYNRALSLRRARRIEAFLLRRSRLPDRVVHVSGVGETGATTVPGDPVREVDRRVEIDITYR